MLERVRSGPSGLRFLLDKCKATTSADIARSLIVVITRCRREGPTQPAESIAALFELLESLDLWGLGQSVATGMTWALHSAVYEDGLPEAVDRKKLAEFIEQAFAQADSGSSARIDDLSLSTAGLCASLAAWDQLINVLATRPGAREEVMLKLEVMLRDMAKNDKELYDLYNPEVSFAMQALRTSRNCTEN
jgi:hypothetical protein